MMFFFKYSCFALILLGGGISGFCAYGEGLIGVKRLVLEQEQWGDKEQVVIDFSPEWIRIEQPQRRFVLLYGRSSQHFIGLETRDGLYWEFSWKEVQEAAQASVRSLERLRQLNLTGLASYDLEQPYVRPWKEEPSRYLWKETGKKKEIQGLKVMEWQGLHEEGKEVKVWCTATPMPSYKEALGQLKAIQKPMALVAVQPILPEVFFDAVQALAKAKVLPLWVGKRGEEVRFVCMHGVQVASKRFQVPQGYRKTSLQALEGIASEIPLRKGHGD